MTATDILNILKRFIFFNPFGRKFCENNDFPADIAGFRYFQPNERGEKSQTVNLSSSPNGQNGWARGQQPRQAASPLPPEKTRPCQNIPLQGKAAQFGRAGSLFKRQKTAAEPPNRATPLFQVAFRT